MILFFGDSTSKVFAVQTLDELSNEAISKLIWLFGNQPKINQKSIASFFVGPRASIISPWGTNAVEITRNMDIKGVLRIEKYQSVDVEFKDFDPILFQKLESLDQQIFETNLTPDPILVIEDIASYNQQEGLALSNEEIDYLKSLSKKLQRPLTDSEVFGFSQVNSEHCRHKIFNGTFILDGEKKPNSLFELIRKTSAKNPKDIVSAYEDNVAFIKGPEIIQFAPASADKPDFYRESVFESVLSLKAETHNFPTTVEPFNGAATGSGGEIRDRLAGGKGSIPLAGTAVYMTSYSRLEENRDWEDGMPPRKWLYQTPVEILLKASNGASDFGNKFGQPLISGSLFTFEYKDKTRKLGFDKVIMQAGGIGYGKKTEAFKETPEAEDAIVILGGDNYRIGMGGASISSLETQVFSSGAALNAIQRSNPEMQKRVANTIRGMVESSNNTIVSIHDHGAGGHLNCLSELVEKTGGKIDLDKLPIGDSTLSDKEIIGNESQERMGLVIAEKNRHKLQRIADRERTPVYVVGKVTKDHKFIFKSETTHRTPIDLEISDMFGKLPKTTIEDKTVSRNYPALEYHSENFIVYLKKILQLEAVACKDWLTNKVDRCVGGRVAKQQCAGPLQLPLNNVGVMALDFKTLKGIATSIGHAPISGLIDPVAGSRNAVAEALSNLIWAPLKEGINNVSLSANWMWACRNKGEDDRLYKAVEAISDFAIQLGINIPTGKDSLSMKQKYTDDEVICPGTVIVSSIGNCIDITKVVEPVFKIGKGSIYYLNLSQDTHKLGGSSFAQILKKIGNEAPTIKDATFFKNAFNGIQKLILTKKIAAGHDISSGGLITTLLEMCFASERLGAEIDVSVIGEKDSIKLLFSENNGIVFQGEDISIEKWLHQQNIEFFKIGEVKQSNYLKIKNYKEDFSLPISEYRDIWYQTSYLLDKKQTANELATDRFQNYKQQALKYKFPKNFAGKLLDHSSKTPKPKAAILREKGSNSEREMANAMYLAGFEVKDVHMTDLVSGRETLEDIQFIGAVGGFSNSDVLGSAKGWAGAFKFNEKAKVALERFFEREDTLSVGICNGCQLFMELELMYPEHEIHGKMHFNDSQKHESNFISVVVPQNQSVMLSSLSGSTLGVWISHGEGKFHLPLSEDEYEIVAKYAYASYPANPNGSDYNTAMMTDKTGRHLVTMPHIERSIFPWNWAYYENGRQDEISPWIEAFINARKWLEKKRKN